MEKLIALNLLVVVYVGAFGWGRLLERWLYGRSIGAGAYSVTLGLLFWLVLGAVLNHVALVLPPVLDLILAAGILFAIWEWRRHAFRFAGLGIDFESVPSIIVLLISGFFAWTLLPAAAFNHHDDFYKYLPRVLRMLQTGTLGGDPFDFVGLDSLGMQSFFQGFFLSHLPMPYINAFDAVFCQVLAALLINALGRQLGIHWFIRILAVSALLIPNPQYVNVSSLYSGMVMVAGLTLATYFWVSNFDASLSTDVLKGRMALPIGVFIAALAGLKVTLIPYAGAYFLTLILMLLMRSDTRKVTLQSVVWIGLPACLLYAAWAALAWEKFAELTTMVVKKVEGGAGALFSVLTDIGSSIDPENLSRFGNACGIGTTFKEKYSYLQEVINRGELFYGGHIFQYLGFVALISFTVCTLAVLWYRRPDKQIVLLPAVTAGIACLVSVGGVLLGVYGIHVDALVRYNALVIIAVLPILGLFYFAVIGEKERPKSPASVAASLAGLLVLGSPIAAHAGLWLERAQLAYKAHHILAYPVSQATVRAMEQLLSEKVRAWSVSVQNKIPIGATALSWVSTPFHFDFSRNSIFTLASPWRIGPIANVNDAVRADWLQQRLVEAGVDYIIWEYKGSQKERGGNKVVLAKALRALAGRKAIIYRSPNWVVFSIR